MASFNCAKSHTLKNQTLGLIRFRNKENLSAFRSPQNLPRGPHTGRRFNNSENQPKPASSSKTMKIEPRDSFGKNTRRHTIANANAASSMEQSYAYKKSDRAQNPAMTFKKPKKWLSPCE